MRIFIPLLLLFAVVEINAAIITAAGCTQKQVQAAIDQSRDGDIVVIPAGTGIWKTVTSQTPCVTIGGKAILLKGSGTNETTILDSVGSNWNECLLRVDGVEGKPFRISNLTVSGNGIDSANTYSKISIYGTCKNWRIDHIISNGVNTIFGTNGETFGVIDHSTIATYSHITIFGGASSWKDSLSLGTDKAVYIEDCTFNITAYGNVVDGHSGSRFVFRYNTVIGSWVEVHGYCCNLDRGTKNYEIYDNTLTGKDTDSPFSLRGGTGVVFDNSINGTYNRCKILVENDRSCPDRAWQGVCGDTVNYKMQPNWPRDGWQDATGWPCRDQIGRGPDSASKQKSAPLYVWNNTFNGALVNVQLNSALCAAMANHIKKDRDYFEGTPWPGYKPYAYPHPLTLFPDLPMTPVQHKKPSRLRGGTQK